LLNRGISSVIREDIRRSCEPTRIARMMPNRTLPIVGKTTLPAPGRWISSEPRPRSILRRLASSLSERRQVPDPREVAYLVQLDRNLDLIEHQTCDCL
jgi:hypothetical protein